MSLNENLVTLETNVKLVTFNPWGGGGEDSLYIL